MTDHVRAWVSAEAASKVTGLGLSAVRDRTPRGTRQVVPRREVPNSGRGRGSFAYWPWGGVPDDAAPNNLAWMPGQDAELLPLVATVDDGVSKSRQGGNDTRQSAPIPPPRPFDAFVLDARTHAALYDPRALYDAEPAPPGPYASVDPRDVAPPPTDPVAEALASLASDGFDETPDDFDEDTVEIDVGPKCPTDRPWSIAWISDVHVPEHDVAAVNAWLAWLRDIQPDEVILGGDIAEMGSCSEHGGVANPLSLVDDIKALKDFLRRVRGVVPKAKLTFLEGNHCTRLKRIAVHKIPTWSGAIDIPSLCDFAGLGISWHLYGALVQRGKLRFTHGAYVNEHHAANHLRKFGCSLVYGHTHRGQTFTRATADMEMQAAFGMPSMRTLQPEWLGGAPSGWGHGFGYFLVMPDDGSFTAYTPFITRGRFVWADGKVYDGNVK